MLKQQKFHRLIPILLCAVLVACGGGGGGSSSEEDDGPVIVQMTGPELIDPTGFISGVRIGDIEGRFFSGAAPESTVNTSFAPNDDDPVTIISGGSTSLSFGNAMGIFNVYVTSDDEGYFLVELPEVVTEVALVVSYSTIQLDGDTGLIQVQLESPDGSVTDPLDVSVTTLSVGTGEVQVSVSWDQPVDLDLKVVEPDGTEIFFIFPVSDSGGELDLDSNAGCSIDGVNNENVTYDGVTPLAGEYRVMLNLWSDCGVTAPVNYVVTIRANGDVRTFRGVIAEDDSEVEITNFTVNGN